MKLLILADSQFGTFFDVHLSNVEFQVVQYITETTRELCKQKVWERFDDEYDGCLLVVGYNDLIGGESMYTTIAKTRQLMNAFEQKSKHVQVTMSSYWDDTQKSMFETAFYQDLLRGCYSDYQGTHFAKLCQLQFHWNLKHQNHSNS